MLVIFCVHCCNRGFIQNSVFINDNIRHFYQCPLLGCLTDDENDQPIPFFLLPDDSQKVKKSPLLNRSGSPPHIQLVSLKNFSGLENVRAGQLSGQDSVDAAPHRLRQQQTQSTDRVPENISMIEENKVKIQVPGLPAGKGGKNDEH